ncbi:hypothetical protein MG293_019349 [Ovis ammon polii]|uniref:Uncharacterized protein n=1 Tax=Ovis ammon polii TaxID=230172 RepID=A0AAD4TQD3_OVIAM|nr:hypothetical protein MG293_019349 [Ovis ammon polii]KAI4550764.1 hypothetical protein MJT46_018271 [Ovis ammon polii x Ovis aries]
MDRKMGITSNARFPGMMCRVYSLSPTTRITASPEKNPSNVSGIAKFYFYFTFLLRNRVMGIFPIDPVSLTPACFRNVKAAYLKMQTCGTHIMNESVSLTYGKKRERTIQHLGIFKMISKEFWRRHVASHQHTHKTILLPDVILCPGKVFEVQRSQKKLSDEKKSNFSDLRFLELSFP